MHSLDATLCLLSVAAKGRSLHGKHGMSVKRMKWWNRKLTLKCKLKCNVKPLKDPLGASPSKGNQGTTRGKEKILLTSVGIEPTTSGLDVPLL